PRAQQVQLPLRGVLAPHRSSPSLFFSHCRTPRDLRSFPTRRSSDLRLRLRPALAHQRHPRHGQDRVGDDGHRGQRPAVLRPARVDRKSTRLNSSHLGTSYAVFCLKKKTTDIQHATKTVLTNSAKYAL